jgi:outer membrane murein-binding lipoprotein Lpp
MAVGTARDRNRRLLFWARATVVGVFLAGLVVVVGPALPHLGSLFDDPFEAQVERRVVETFDAAGHSTGRTVTTAPAGSLMERALAAGGVLLLRIAVVAAAAFLAGAVVYRTGSGNFPSEIGGVKFAEQASAGLDELKVTVEKLGLQVARLTAKVDTTAEELANVREAGAEGLSAVAGLNARFDATEQDTGQIAAAVAALAEELDAFEKAAPRPAPRSPKRQ